MMMMRLMIKMMMMMMVMVVVMTIVIVFIMTMTAEQMVLFTEGPRVFQEQAQRTGSRHLAKSFGFGCLGFGCRAHGQGGVFSIWV